MGNQLACGCAMQESLVDTSLSARRIHTDMDVEEDIRTLDGSDSNFDMLDLSKSLPAPEWGHCLKSLPRVTRIK